MIGASFWAVARRWVARELRYPMETAFEVVAFYVIFLVLFLGGRALGSEGFKEGPLSSIIIGYVVFLLVQQAFQSFTTMVRLESVTGTIEQVAMSRVGLSGVLCMNLMVHSVLEIGRMSILLTLVVFTTGRRLSVDVVSLLPVTVLMMVGVGGLGLGIGGLTLVFRRFESVSGMIQLSFLGLLAAPIERVAVLRAVPVSQGFDMIERIAVEGMSLGEIGPEAVVWLGVGSLVFGATGYWVFRRSDRVARKRGLLGHY